MIALHAKEEEVRAAQSVPLVISSTPPRPHSIDACRHGSALLVEAQVQVNADTAADGMHGPRDACSNSGGGGGGGGGGGEWIVDRGPRTALARSPCPGGDRKGMGRDERRKALAMHSMRMGTRDAHDDED